MVTPPTTITIAARVRAAMDEAGLTEKSLAEATGIARTTLRRRLAAFQSFTTAELAAIASQVDVSLTDLLADERVAS